MFASLTDILRCPVTKEKLTLEVLSTGQKTYEGVSTEIIFNGILRSKDFIYPVIDGIPRLIVEAFRDYRDFLKLHAKDFNTYEASIEKNYAGLLKFVTKKNARTKKSFSQEWGLFNYEEDKVWDADTEGMLQRFLQENDESKESLKGKLILDAGCGNGLLNQRIAACGATIIGMDFSQSILRAFQKNDQKNAIFIQGDVQFPPVAFEAFDIVHSSGVLICTTNSELTFSCLEPCVKPGGKISVWLYHPRKDFIHNCFNFLREYTSKLPIKLQYYLYTLTILPISFVIKRLKGNKQNRREMMIDILDWFSPEFRWEHEHDEAAAWYYKRNYRDVKVTTNEMFGFNIIGYKQS
ncbi:MAG: methyltransferase domain-containing protein [Chitinophagaceae bacterium]|nr:methyltransferase domain-containing protein [Chitinophagaceae bacterium]